MKLLDQIKLAFASNQKVIDKIHHEFDVAGEQLLKEANEILNNSNFKTDKTKLLKEIGFKNTKEVVETDRKIKTKTIAGNTVNLINEYKFHYPNQKFITKEMVDQICEKYSLVCGEIGLYKGFVPLTNLKQIKNFKLKEIHFNYGIRNTGFFSSFLGESGYILKSRAEFLNQEKEKYESTQRRLEQEQLNKKYQIRLPIDFVTDYGQYKIVDLNLELLICAPLKDMKMNGKQLFGNWIREIPDPVVLQPVIGGFLILTAWGEEASDPLVVNESQN